MNRDKMRRAADRKRVVRTVGAGGGFTVRWSDPCQICGTAPEGWSIKNDAVPRYHTEPMWPGGPSVTTGYQPEGWTITGTHLTLIPCGHEQPEPGEWSTYEKVITP